MERYHFIGKTEQKGRSLNKVKIKYWFKMDRNIVNRDDIHIISRHSNWSEDGVEKLLKDEIYADAKSWNKFLQILLISLGVGFSVSGIIFFFAYNWTNLHKFAKIGMTEALVVALTLFVILSKLNQSKKNIILTGTSVLVGVMIAVFGQIYQTGANAYDFFLGWTAFITLWVLVSNYPPLWLVYLVLVNTTFVLYSQQVASHWTAVFIISILFFFNASFLLFSLYLPKFKNELKVPVWFTNILALATVSLSTVGICIGIFETGQSFLALFVITASTYGLGLKYGFKNKSGFYLSIIPFSVIIIFSTLMARMSFGIGMFLVISLFIIISVSLLIKGLVDIQKKWNNE